MVRFDGIIVRTGGAKRVCEGLWSFLDLEINIRIEITFLFTVFYKESSLADFREFNRLGITTRCIIACMFDNITLNLKLFARLILGYRHSWGHGIKAWR